MTSPTNGSYGTQFSHVRDDVTKLTKQLSKNPTELGRLEIAVLKAFMGVTWIKDVKTYESLKDGISILAKSVREGEDVGSLQQGIGKMQKACEFLRKSPKFKKNGDYLEKLAGLTESLREANASLVRANIGANLNQLYEVVSDRYDLVKSLGQHLREQSGENRRLAELLHQDFSKMSGLDVIHSAFEAIELIYIGLFQLEEQTARPTDGAIIKQIEAFKNEMAASLQASPEFKNNLVELDQAIELADLNLGVFFMQSKIGTDLKSVIQELRSLQFNHPKLEFRDLLGIGSIFGTNENSELDLLVDRDFRKISAQETIATATQVLDRVTSGLNQLVRKERLTVEDPDYQHLANKLADISYLVEILNKIVVRN